MQKCCQECDTQGSARPLSRLVWQLFLVSFFVDQGPADVLVGEHFLDMMEGQLFLQTKEKIPGKVAANGTGSGFLYTFIKQIRITEAELA